jgi:hypothetical protein
MARLDMGSGLSKSLAAKAISDVGSAGDPKFLIGVGGTYLVGLSLLNRKANSREGIHGQERHSYRTNRFGNKDRLG